MGCGDDQPLVAPSSPRSLARQPAHLRPRLGSLRPRHSLAVLLWKDVGEVVGRPRKFPERTSTGIRFMPDTHARLVKAAEERDVTVNWLVNRACEDFLDRLIPVDEIRWTR